MGGQGGRKNRRSRCLMAGANQVGREGGREEGRKRKSSVMGGKTSERKRYTEPRQQQAEEGQVQREDPGDGETEWGRTEGGIDGIKKEGLIVNGRVVWKSS